jgi:hypothetical protein
MLIDTATIKTLAKYYGGELPADGIRFTMSLLRKGKFSAEYKAHCIMKILYLDNLLKRESITSEGWNAIHDGL